MTNIYHSATLVGGVAGVRLRAFNGYALQNIDNDCHMIAEIAEIAARLRHTIAIKANNFGKSLMESISSNSPSQTQTGNAICPQGDHYECAHLKSA